MPSASTGPRMLSQSQIYTIALLTGMPKPRIMTAIAMAESSGNTRAHNAQPPDNSYGLWQINMLGDMGPERRRQFGISSNEQLYDPITNAFAAKKILASQGLGAWSTYTDGSYLKYMDKAVKKEADSLEEVQQAAWVPDLPGIPDPDDDSFMDLLVPDGTLEIAEGVFSVAESIQKAAFWIIQPKNWVRVGYVVGGGIVVALALRSIVASTGPGKKATAAVGKVADGAMSVLPGGGTLKGAGRAAGQAVKKKVKKS